MPLGQYEITDFAIIEIRSMNSGLIAILFFFSFRNVPSSNLAFFLHDARAPGGREEIGGGDDTGYSSTAINNNNNKKLRTN